MGYGIKIFHPSHPNYVTRSPVSLVAKIWVRSCLVFAQHVFQLKRNESLECDNSICLRVVLIERKFQLKVADSHMGLADRKDSPLERESVE